MWCWSTTSHDSSNTILFVVLWRNCLFVIRKWFWLCWYWQQVISRICQSFDQVGKTSTEFEVTFSFLTHFYLSTDKNESLALLFKIFTKIWLLSRQASADEPDMHVEDRLAGMLSKLFWSRHCIGDEVKSVTCDNIYAKICILWGGCNSTPVLPTSFNRVSH